MTVPDLLNARSEIAGRVFYQKIPVAQTVPYVVWDAENGEKIEGQKSFEQKKIITVLFVDPTQKNVPPNQVDFSAVASLPNLLNVEWENMTADFQGAKFVPGSVLWDAPSTPVIDDEGLISCFVRLEYSTWWPRY